MASTTVKASTSASAATAVVQVLQNKNDKVNALYGQQLSQQAARIAMYVKDTPTINLVPTFAGTVAKYAAIGGGIGAGVGAVCGGGVGSIPAAAFGGLVGLGAGTTVGIIIAYNEQADQYQTWLKDKRNTSVNNEVLEIVKQIAKDKVNGGDDRYSHITDSIHNTFMEIPVYDPTTGARFDYQSIRKWVTQHGTNPINVEMPLKMCDLRTDFETLGRLNVLYRQILKDQIKGVALSANQKICIQMLANDLKKNCINLFKKARDILDVELNSGKISLGQYGDRIQSISRMLDPIS